MTTRTPRSYYYAGQGLLWAARVDPRTGAPMGYRPLGNIPSVTVTPTYAAQRSSTFLRGVSQTDDSRLSAIGGRLTAVIESLSLANLAWLAGEGIDLLPPSVVLNVVTQGTPGAFAYLPHPLVDVNEPIGVVASTSLSAYTAAGVPWDYYMDEDAGLIYLNDGALEPRVALTAAAGDRVPLTVTYTRRGQAAISCGPSAGGIWSFLFQGLNTVDGKLVTIRVPMAQVQKSLKQTLINEELGSVPLEATIIPDLSAAEPSLFEVEHLPQGFLAHGLLPGVAAPPAPAPAPSTDPVSLPTSYLLLTDHGGVGDGSTDNSAAIAAAVAAAKLTAHKAVRITAGTFNYSEVIHDDSVTLFGDGDESVLHATDWANTAIFMEGDGPRVLNLKMTGVEAPSRQSPWEATRITVMGATNWTIDSLTIVGSSAAGIQLANAANNGTITNNNISGTLADSIHMTAGAHHVEVAYNLVDGAGDDGIAVVSYSGQTRCNNVTAHHNTVRNQVHGRNMSVVGGDAIHYHHNLLQSNPQFSGLYLVAEDNEKWLTTGIDGVTAEYNTIEDCGSAITGHAGVFIASDGAELVTNITVRRNNIVQTGTERGIRYEGNLTNVLLDSNRIVNAGTDYVGGAHAGVTIIEYTSGDYGHLAP